MVVELVTSSSSAPPARTFTARAADEGQRSCTVDGLEPASCRASPDTTTAPDSASYVTTTNSSSSMRSTKVSSSTSPAFSGAASGLRRKTTCRPRKSWLDSPFGRTPPVRIVPSSRRSRSPLDVATPVHSSMPEPLGPCRNTIFLSPSAASAATVALSRRQPRSSGRQRPAVWAGAPTAGAAAQGSCSSSSSSSIARSMAKRRQID